MPHPPTFRELIEKHTDEAHLIGAHKTSYTSLPSIFHEGLIPEKLAVRAGLKEAPTPGNDPDTVYFHPIETPPKPSEEPPNFPIVHLFVKLPKNASWVRDQRTEIPLASHLHQYAEIHSTKRVKPERIIALQLQFNEAERRKKWFNSVRSREVHDLYARVALKPGDTIRKRHEQFTRKTDEEIVDELSDFVTELCGPKAKVKHKLGENGTEIHIPWIDLALAAARKKGIPVYGWDGKLIE